MKEVASHRILPSLIAILGRKRVLHSLAIDIFHMEVTHHFYSFFIDQGKYPSYLLLHKILQKTQQLKTSTSFIFLLNQQFGQVWQWQLIPAPCVNGDGLKAESWSPWRPAHLHVQCHCWLVAETQLGLLAGTPSHASPHGYLTSSPYSCWVPRMIIL